MNERGEIKATADIKATFDSLREIQKINSLACTHYLNKILCSMDLKITFKSKRQFIRSNI